MTPEEKYKLQSEYCSKNGMPLFAPRTCYRCHSQVFQYVTENAAKSKLITGCPVCNKSFVS